MTNPYPTPAQPQPAAKVKAKRRWVLPTVTGVACLVVGIGIGGSGGGTSTAATAGAPATFTKTQVVTVPAVPSTVTQPPAAPAGPATTVGDGVYQIGADVAAGRYKTTGPSDGMPCYYAILNSTSATDIATNNVLQGAGYLTAPAGKYPQLTGGCTWTKS
jgi:hypothetical protein